MASVIKAGNATDGVQVTSDNTGILELKTGTGSGTTAMTIGTDQSVTFAATPTYSGGTANGVAYLNASKALTTGTALVFDGTNLGQGVTPSAWGQSNSIKVIQTPGGSFWNYETGTVGNIYVGQNYYYDGSNRRYIATAKASEYQQGDGVHRLLGAPSGTAGNTFTFTTIFELSRGTSLALEGATTQTGTGITFPATQSASSNANTLDDYEEGNWTPVLSSGSGTITSYTSSGTYTKIGRTVILNMTYSITNNGTGASYGIISGFPFTTNASGTNAVTRIGGTTGFTSTLETGPNSTSATLWTYANAYPWATNANGSICIVYQV